MAQTTIQGSFLGDGTVTGVKIGADFISAQTALTTGLATADELIVSDGGVIKKMAISVLRITADQITASGTLPALNGAALTALTAANITASGTLPALNGAALTALTAANITASGTLPVLNGSALTNLDADDLATGTVPVARLGDGNESNSTFLRGDNTWVAVSGTTINTNADNRVITGSGTANTLNGEANLTFDGSTLTTLNTDIVLSDAQGLSWKRESDSLVRNMIKTTLYSGGVYHIDIGHESSNFRDIRFIADGASAAPYMTIKALTGNIEVAAGNVVIGTAGKGIDFSAQTASSTATVGDEVLNHYEEGQFIPHVWDSSKTTNSNVTYNNRLGRYTRIGNIVFFTVSWNPLALTGLTGTSQAFVGGLPFTCSNTNYGSNTSLRHGLALGYIAGLSMPSGTSMMQARMDAGRADLDISWTNTGSQASGITYAKVQDLGGDWIIDITGHYEVA